MPLAPDAGGDGRWQGETAVVDCSLDLKRGDLPEFAKQKMHMDIASNVSHMPTRILLTRGAIFFGWMVAFLCCMGVIGLLPTVPIFVIAYMRLEGPEKWRHALTMAAVMMLLIYGVFDQLLAVPWPPTLLGTWFPALKVIPSV